MAQRRHTDLRLSQDTSRTLERTEWRRVTAAGLLIILALLIGFCVGALVGTQPDPAWFEAVGTWVGAGVSGLAVFLAFRIFRSEDYMRRMEAAGAERERQERKRELERSIRLDAALVIISGLRIGDTRHLNYGGYGNMRDPHFSVAVFNGAGYAIEDVSIRETELCPQWRDVAPVIGAGHTAERGPFATKLHLDLNDIKTAVMARKNMEIRFTMSGKTWISQGGDTKPITTDGGD